MEKDTGKIKGGYIYIMTNEYKTTLYIGVCSNLQRRVWEHKTHYFKGSFTDKYNLDCCIYYEHFPDIEQAINREKELKKWRRSKKDELINQFNPDWKDLWSEIEAWRGSEEMEENDQN